MSLSMSSRTAATAPAHISFSTDSRRPALVNKSPNLLLTSDLELGGGVTELNFPYLNLTWMQSKDLDICVPGSSGKELRRTQGTEQWELCGHRNFILCPLESPRFS